MEKKLKEFEEKVAHLEKENEEIKQDLKELENNWKRALADYRNLQKRVVEEKQDFVDYANASLIRRVIGVLDNLEMLNNHIDDMGLGMITKELKQILTDEGLKEIEAMGKEYDAQTMEAIEVIPGKKNLVLEVAQKGYFLKNKLLRPARVKTGNGESAAKKIN